MWDVTEVCTRFWWGNLRERDHWGDRDVDGRIILIRILRKWEGVVGTGWSWLRTGTGGGRLWVRWWTFGFQKMRWIAWLAAKPVSFSRRTLLHVFIFNDYRQRGGGGEYDTKWCFTFWTHFVSKCNIMNRNQITFLCACHYGILRSDAGDYVPRETAPCYPLIMTLGGLQSQPGQSGEEENFVLAGNQTTTFCPKTSSYAD